MGTGKQVEKLRAFLKRAFKNAGKQAWRSRYLESMVTGGFFRNLEGRQERRRSEQEQAQRRHCSTSPTGRRGPRQRWEGSAAVSRTEPRGRCLSTQIPHPTV